MVAQTTLSDFRPLFPLGQVVATPGALALLEKHQQNGLDYLRRHVRGDWGDVCPEDWTLNDEAVTGEMRILSSYAMPGGGPDDKIWIITEWDRSTTTILLPSDY